MPGTAGKFSDILLVSVFVKSTVAVQLSTSYRYRYLAIPIDSPIANILFPLVGSKKKTEICSKFFSDPVSEYRGHVMATPIPL